jgi:hypothetical protein
VRFNRSDSGNFTNSISEFSGFYGVSVLVASPTFRSSLIENNTSNGVIISSSGAPDLGTSADNGKNTFQSNDSSGFDVFNGVANTINAIGNFWGFTTVAEIDSHIRDDNEASVGEVFFVPFLSEDQSLPVKLSSFTTVASDDGVLLK